MNEKQQRKWTIVTWIALALGLLEIYYILGMRASFPDTSSDIGAYIFEIGMPLSLFVAAWVSVYRPVRHSQIVAILVIFLNISLPIIYDLLFNG